MMLRSVFSQCSISIAFENIRKSEVLADLMGVKQVFLSLKSHQRKITITLRKLEFSRRFLSELYLHKCFGAR